MVYRRSVDIFLLGWGMAWLAGCASAPVNRVRLIGSEALDLSGTYPGVVAFERGAFSRIGDAGSVILTGPAGVLLFDYRGHHNRFELLLTRDAQSILYCRVDQRPTMTGDGRRIGSPIGVRIDRETPGLEGRFDVMLGRVDLRGFGPALEHFPKYMRVRGRFAVPRYPEPIGPTTQPAAFWQPPGSVSAGSTPPGLADVDDGWLMRTFAAELPPLAGAARADHRRTASHAGPR